MILKKITTGSLGTNCYIVFDETSREAAIFDPADNADMLYDVLKGLEADLKYIIVTHAHFDHIAALDDLKAMTGAMVCIGADDADGLNDSRLNLSGAFGSPPPITKADVSLKDNSTLKLGSEEIVFIHTPGHTVGGMCAYFDNKLISGDTLFFESIGRSDFPGGNMSVLLNSIKTKLYTLPGDTPVYPGHGDNTTIAHEIKNNPFTW